MILFLTLAAVIWGVGWLMRTPRQARWLMIGLVYLGFVAALIVLPEGLAVRETLGGSAAAWLSVGAVAAAIYAYSEGLKRLRTRVRPENRQPDAPPTTEGPLTDGELDRYARHIVLREIGGTGQRRLKEARVLVIGAGGLGSPALLYLAAAGVGTLGVIDDDDVDVSNLQRQILHRDDGAGMPKAFSAKAAIAALNPLVEVRPYRRRLTAEIARDLLRDYDLVLDGSDQFGTRATVNRACVAAGVPLVSGAIAQWEGQLGVFDPARGGPCLACVFPEAPAPGLAPDCAEAGVVGPLPGVVGAMMALEAVKLLTGAGTPLVGAMLIYDGLEADSRRIVVSRQPDCPICGAVSDRAPSATPREAPT